MRTSVQAILTVLSAGMFFTAVYVAYLCMYLAPTSGLRDWGATRWGLLLLLGPAGFKEVFGFAGMAMLLFRRPALAPVPAYRGRRSRLGESANRQLPSMMSEYASGRIPAELELSEVFRCSETRG